MANIFFSETATTEIYTLSLHDALPILHTDQERDYFMQRYHDEPLLPIRSEERFSRNAETDLVCRLLLEKKKGHIELGGDPDISFGHFKRQLAGLQYVHPTQQHQWPRIAGGKAGNGDMAFGG